MTTAEDYYNKAEELYSEDDFKEAIKHYSKAIELNPNDEWAYLRRGDCYKKLEQYEKAIEDYAKAIELNPNNERGYFEGIYTSRASCYEELRQYEEAIADYEKVIELYPDCDTSDIYTVIVYINDTAKEYYNKKGSELINEGEYEKAIECYTKLVKLNPNYKWTDDETSDDERIYLGRGYCYENLEQYEEAIADYTKFLESYSYNYDAYIYRGSCYKKLQRYEEAIEDFKKALELNLDDEPLKDLIKKMIEETKTIEAIKNLSEVLNGIDPIFNDDCKESDNPSNYCEKLEKAYTDFSKVLVDNDSFKEIKGMLNEMRAGVSQIKEIFNSTIINMTEEELFIKARELKENKDFLGAVECYSRLIELNPDNIQTYMLRIECYVHLIRPEKILGDCEKIMGLTNGEIVKNEVSKMVTIAHEMIEWYKFGIVADIPEIVEKIENEEILEKYKKEISELSEAELYLFKAKGYLMDNDRRKFIANVLIACIYDDSKREEAEALYDKIPDENTAIKLKKSFYNTLDGINGLRLSTKEKIEHLRNFMKKENTINVDVISNMYTNSKAGRKLDL